MRTIKFRGKDIETGQWLSGCLIQRIGYMPSIIFPYESNGKVRYSECAVIRETVGQFTGITDKNGKEIYEGDIITFDNYLQGLSRVVYDYSGYYAESKTYSTLLRPTLEKHISVIGNIHDNPDNPELLKVGTKDFFM